MIEDALVTLIKSAAVVAASNARVKPFLREGTPAIVYTNISSEMQRSESGEEGFEQSRWQIDCWSNTYESSRSLARSVRGVLDNHRGVVGSDYIELVLFQSMRDDYDVDAKLHRVILEYEILQ